MLLIVTFRNKKKVAFVLLPVDCIRNGGSRWRPIKRVFGLAASGPELVRG